MNKRLFLIFTLIVMIVTSCNEASKNRLRGEIEKANKDCPIDLGLVGEISSITYENDEAVLTMSISEDMHLDMSAMNNMKNYIKSNMMSILARDESSLALMKEIKAADSGMTLVIRNADNRTMKIQLTPEEVAKVADGKISALSAKEAIQYNIQVANSQCPTELSDGITLMKMSLEGKYVIYNYSVDETKANLSLLRKNATQLKQELSKGLHSDPTATEFMKYCTQDHDGIVYRYVGDTSGETVDITFEPNEL